MKSPFGFIRKQCKAGNTVLVSIVDGDCEPNLVGECGHWVRGHQKRYKQPKFPGWKYTPSSRKIEVGIDWFLNNAPEESVRAFILHRLNPEQNSIGTMWERRQEISQERLQRKADIDQMHKERKTRKQRTKEYLKKQLKSTLK